MPHRETGDDESYDFVASGGEEDGPFAEAGLPVVDLAFVTVTEDAMDDGRATPTPTETPAGTPDGMAESEPFASVDFSNQEIQDGAVTVGETILSDGGFVTLHDARLFGGMPFESVVGISEYLEPGRHRNLDVELDGPHDEITQVALPAPPLVPMPHMDTNDNQAYEFVTSEGAEDGPYSKAGQAAVDIGLVTPEPEVTGTPEDTDDDRDH